MPASFPFVLVFSLVIHKTIIGFPYILFPAILTSKKDVKHLFSRSSQYLMLSVSLLAVLVNVCALKHSRNCFCTHLEDIYTILLKVYSLNWT